MLIVELVPDKNHCIETVARQEHSRVMEQLLSSKETDNELSARLEILRLFLEMADFKKLRSDSDRYLVKGGQVRFNVYLDGDVLKYEMQVDTTGEQAGAVPD
jgi:hypothetical protein